MSTLHKALSAQSAEAPHEKPFIYQLKRQQVTSSAHFGVLQMGTQLRPYLTSVLKQ